jgi:hypothetical protein
VLLDVSFHHLINSIVVCGKFVVPHSCVPLAALHPLFRGLSISLLSHRISIALTFREPLERNREGANSLVETWQSRLTDVCDIGCRPGYDEAFRSISLFQFQQCFLQGLPVMGIGIPI